MENRVRMEQGWIGLGNCVDSTGVGDELISLTWAFSFTATGSTDTVEVPHESSLLGSGLPVDMVLDVDPPVPIHTVLNRGVLSSTQGLTQNFK